MTAREYRNFRYGFDLHFQLVLLGEGLLEIWQSSFAFGYYLLEIDGRRCDSKYFLGLLTTKRHLRILS